MAIISNGARPAFSLAAPSQNAVCLRKDSGSLLRVKDSSARSAAGSACSAIAVRAHRVSTPSTPRESLLSVYFRRGKAQRWIAALPVSWFRPHLSRSCSFRGHDLPGGNARNHFPTSRHNPHSTLFGRVPSAGLHSLAIAAVQPCLPRTLLPRPAGLRAPSFPGGHSPLAAYRWFAIALRPRESLWPRQWSG